MLQGCNRWIIISNPCCCFSDSSQIMSSFMLCRFHSCIPCQAKKDPCVEQFCNSYWLVRRIMSLGDDVSCLFIFVSFLLLLWFMFLPICIDMWAMGAIMTEMFTLHPLFPGARYASEVAIGHCSSHFTGHYIFWWVRCTAELLLLLN